MTYAQLLAQLKLLTATQLSKRVLCHDAPFDMFTVKAVVIDDEQVF